MAPPKVPPSFPPYRIHKTDRLAPSTAQSLLTEYIKSSQDEKKAYLHPTSLLVGGKVIHGLNVGPTGGLAMHHLRRIEAGLRGKCLAAETEEELRARFDIQGKEQVESQSAETANNETGQPGILEGDDVMSSSSRKANGKKRRKEDDDNGSKKRQRTAKEISAWAEESSRAGSPADDVQNLAEYELSQQPIIGEVGDRDGAPMVKQNGPPPVVLKHDKDGNIKVPKEKPKTDMDKAERKAAKRERRKVEKRAKLEANSAG